MRRIVRSVLVLCAAATACAGAAGMSPAADEWTDPTTGMRFVALSAGRFVMGSPLGEEGREPQESQHQVVISRPFWMGRYEVTQEQWQAVMGANPSWFAGGEANLPVERVSWLEVQEFLRRLTARAPGNRFRLPTEAEWEYACRAGTATAYNTGTSLAHQQASFSGAAGDAASARQTSPVGSFAPNAWGLYDLHGNVWEWTEDEHCPYPDVPVVDPLGSCGGELKVIRGGSWYFGADSARCALRYTHRPGDRGFSLGFRVVREALGPAP